MLAAEHSKCHIRKCPVDVTMLHVSGCGSLWYDQFCKRRAACRDTDVFSECFYGYWEIEWQSKSGCRVVATCDGVVCSAICESQVELIEFDRFDNVELPLVREYSLNDEALDTLV